MGWERYAKVGDKVAYIGCPRIRMWKKFFGMFKLPTEAKHNLVVGEIYEVQNISLVELLDGEVVVGFHIKGFQLRGWGFSLPFPAELFRPLQTRQTNISVFERLLNTAPADELEEA